MLTILLALAFPICPESGPRYQCVHDGDSFHIAGHKVRIANIDTPELNGQCPYERALAIKSRDALQSMMNSGDVTVHRSGRDRDRYGRVLRIVRVNGVDTGQMLVKQGLARVWAGRREGWC